MTTVQAGFAKDLAINKMKGIKIGDVDILVANIEGNFFAIRNKCTHMGCHLTGGSISGNNVICPCHGSTFDLKTGAVVRGPAKEPEPSYKVEVEKGVLQVEI